MANGKNHAAVDNGTPCNIVERGERGHVAGAAQHVVQGDTAVLNPHRKKLARTVWCDHEFACHCWARARKYAGAFLDARLIPEHMPVYRS